MWLLSALCFTFRSPAQQRRLHRLARDVPVFLCWIDCGSKGEEEPAARLVGWLVCQCSGCHPQVPSSAPLSACRPSLTHCPSLTPTPGCWISPHQLWSPSVAVTSFKAKSFHAPFRGRMGWFGKLVDVLFFCGTEKTLKYVEVLENLWKHALNSSWNDNN